MAAAVPVIVAAAGTAATVSSTVKQNQQAARQRESLRTAQSANALSTEIQLLEVEQMKLFNEQQRQLSNAARNQEYALSQQQQEIQKSALEQQAYLQQASNNLQEQLLSRENITQRGQLNQQTNNQKLQLGIQNSFQNIANKNQAFDQLSSLDLNSTSALYQAASQLRDQNLSVEDQNLSVQSQLSSALQELQAQYQNASVEERNAIRNKSALLTSISQGMPLSKSAMQLVENQGTAIDDSIINRILGTDKQSSRAKTDTKFARQRLNENLNNIRQNFSVNRGFLSSGTDLQRNQINRDLSINNAQNNAGFVSNILNVNQLAELQSQGINLDTLLQRDLNNLQNKANLDSLNLDRQALEILGQTSQNTYELGNAQTALETTFGEVALNSRAANVQSIANSERAALNSQINSVQSPGVFPILSGVASGTGSILSTLNQGNSQISATNPFFSSEPVPVLNKLPK